MRRIRGHAWVLACVSGGLQVLIFPKPAFYILSWIALAPLIYAILQCREQDITLAMAEDGRFFAPATASQGFLLGYVSGIIWYLGTCFWVFHTMHVYGGIGVAMSVVVLLLFALYLALYHGLFGLLLALIAARRNGFSLRALVFTPFVWVAIELAKTYVTGFPWDLLGTAQVDNIPLSRVAAVTGVYGISFEIVLVNTADAAAFLVTRERRKVLLTASLAAVIALQAGELVHPPPLPVSEHATLVQANIPILESGDWTLDYLTQTLDSLAALSVRPEHSAPRTPGLIVWPESPAPFFATDLHVRSTLANVARVTDSYIIAGTLGIEHAGEPARQPDIYNSASVIAPNGAWTERYDKIHLVPFGEYLPFAKLFSFAGGLTQQVGTFARGRSRRPLNVADAKVGTFICYEAIFSNDVRQFARHGAEVFVTISNDSWYGEGGAMEQHLNMARMRAVENHRWLLRDTNTGITAAIDPYGRVMAEAPRNQRTQLQAAYSLEHGTTFYTRRGDWFGWLCAIMTLVGLLLRVVAPNAVLATSS